MMGGLFDKIIILTGRGLVELSERRANLVLEIGPEVLQAAEVPIDGGAIEQLNRWHNRREHRDVVHGRSKLMQKMHTLEACSDISQIVEEYQGFFTSDKVSEAFKVIERQLGTFIKGRSDSSIPIDPKLAYALDNLRKEVARYPDLFFDSVHNLRALDKGLEKLPSNKAGKQTPLGVLQECAAIVGPVVALHDALHNRLVEQSATTLRGSRYIAPSREAFLDEVTQEATELSTDLEILFGTLGLYAMSRVAPLGARAGEEHRAATQKLAEQTGKLVNMLRQEFHPPKLEGVAITPPVTEEKQVETPPSVDPELEDYNRELVTSFIKEKFPGIGEEKRGELIEYYCGEGTLDTLEQTYNVTRALLEDQRDTDPARTLSNHPELLLLPTDGKRVVAIKKILGR